MKKGLTGKLEKTASGISILVTLLLPVFLGAVLCRITIMGGSPLWWRIVHGLLFILSLGQAMYLVIFGIIPAVRRKAVRRKAVRRKA